MLGVAISVGLCLLIFFEFKQGFNILYNKQMSDINDFISFASQTGKASVTLDELSDYPEVPMETDDGDVLKIAKYNVKVRLSGTITEEPEDLYGDYVYDVDVDNVGISTHGEESDDSNIDKPATDIAFKCEHKTTGSADLSNALTDFWYGSTDALYNLWNDTSDTYEVEYYANVTASGKVPVLYVPARSMYYMYVLCEDDSYLVLSSQYPFVLTDAPVTAHYGDPGEEPMLAHIYSGYETWAAAKQILALEQKEDEDDTVTVNPYVTEKGGNDTYTAESDDAHRKSMVDAASYKFDKTGSAEGTVYKVDISSDEAKKSEWELTATTYSYEYAGLRLYALSAKRSQEMFSLEGTIHNTLDAERPYVILVKYLNSNKELLGISVIDKRADPLKAKNASTFSVDVSPVRNNIEIQQINSVMFEVY